MGDIKPSHWRCRDCGMFDGPVTNGDCDVCFDRAGNSVQVERLVPADQLREEREGWIRAASIDRTARDALVQALAGVQEERDALRAELDRLRAQQAESLESVRQAWDEVARLHATSGGG